MTFRLRNLLDKLRCVRDQCSKGGEGEKQLFVISVRMIRLWEEMTVPGDLVQLQKRREPRMEPWWTPVKKFLRSQNCTPLATSKERQLRKQTS